MPKYIIEFSDKLFNINSKCFNERNKIFHKFKRELNTFKLKNKISIIVHGSYAEGEITNFSDIDIVLFAIYELSIYEKKILKKLINKINRLLFIEELPFCLFAFGWDCVSLSLKFLSGCPGGPGRPMAAVFRLPGGDRPRRSPNWPINLKSSFSKRSTAFSVRSQSS